MFEPSTWAWVIVLALDVGCPDHFAPLLGFVCDQLCKVDGRQHEHSATEVGKPRLHLGIGEASVDLLVELVDDLRRREPAWRRVGGVSFAPIPGRIWR